MSETSIKTSVWGGKKCAQIIGQKEQNVLEQNMNVYLY